MTDDKQPCDLCHGTGYYGAGVGPNDMRCWKCDAWKKRIPRTPLPRISLVASRDVTMPPAVDTAVNDDIETLRRKCKTLETVRDGLRNELERYNQQAEEKIESLRRENERLLNKIKEISCFVKNVLEGT